MKCARCGFDNPRGLAFCSKCGTSLADPATTCPHCGSENPPGSARCVQCGTLLMADAHLVTAELDHLRAYLSPSLIEALRFDLRSPPPRLLEQCVEHLSDLLRLASTYLPAFVVEQVLADRVTGQADGQFVRGSLLSAALEGLTPLSTRLRWSRERGAQETAATADRFLSAVLPVLREHDGHLVRLGGDGLLALFLEPDSAARAVRAALQIGDLGASLEVPDLHVGVGVHRGDCYAAHLGTPQGMTFALLGSSVKAAIAAGQAAAHGQVLLNRATLQAVALDCQTTPGGDGYLAVEQVAPAAPRAPSGFPSPPIILPPTISGLREEMRLLDLLTPYLPAGLLRQMAADPRLGGPEGERRLATVLLTGVTGPDEMVDRMGPARESEIAYALNACFVSLSRTIHRYGGSLHKVNLGARDTRLLAFFDQSPAERDEAERAVRAALAMQQALSAADSSLPKACGLADLRLSQRIGISYGHVFVCNVGTSWRREYVALGSELSLTSRVMSAAPLDGIAITSDVRRKVRAIFELAPLGQVTLEGKSEPVPILSIAGLRTMPEPVAGLQGLQSPLVGREAEWVELLASVDRLLSRQGRIAWLTGDAGVGKSRLVAELREHIAGGRYPTVRWVEGRCQSYTQPVSYWPFLEVVQQVVGIDADDTKAERWEKLHDAVAELFAQEEAGDLLPYLANFLSLPLEESEHILQLDAETLQRQTFAAVRTLLEAYARRPPAPLVLALEDIHWMDQASLSLLEYLLPLIHQVPVLLLLTCRPRRSRLCHQVREKLESQFASRTTQIALRPLTQEDSVQLLGHLVPLDRWPAEMCELIFERTEGNPLYLEEVTYALLDTQVLAQDGEGRWYVNGGLDPSGVPDTLRGAMVARLKRLDEPSRRAAQIAAVVGRVFHFDVLAHVWPGDQDRLIQQMGELQQRAIIRQVERMPEPIYSFKHALLQEVCYDSLSTEERRAYHRQIAAYLEGDRSVGRAEVESNYPLIAHHAFAGEDWPRSLRYQVLAGQRAKALYANREAVDHLEKALRSAGNMRPTEMASERQAAHVTLGELLTVTGQYDQAVDYLRRANGLAAERGDCDGQAHTCRLLARLYENRGEYALALSWIREGMMALQSSGRPGCMDVAEAAQFRLLAGLINMRQGHYEAALDQGQRGLTLAQELGELAAQAQAHNLLGNVHRLMGRSGTAIEYMERALDLYRQVGDIRGQAISHNQIATVHFYTSQWREADRSYRQAYDMFGRIGDIYNCAGASNNLGGIALNQGRLDEALRFYREGLRAVEQIGGSLYLIGLFHNNMGATHVRAGDGAAARRHLRTSEEYFEAAQARDVLPELHRHLAELALLNGHLAEAAAQGQRALALARELSMSGEEGCALRVLGEVAIARSDLEQAEQHLVHSLSILEGVGDEYERARSQLALAGAYAVAGRQEEMSHVLKSCVPVFERLDARLDLAAAHALQKEAGDSSRAQGSTAAP